MLRRWHHGHSLGAGVLGGLLLAGHPWTVAVAAFLAGLAVGRFLALGAWAAAALRDRVLTAKRDRRLSTPAAVSPWHDGPQRGPRPYNYASDQGGLPDGY